jgi:hypothetical protein
MFMVGTSPLFLDLSSIEGLFNVLNNLFLTLFMFWVSNSSGI